MIPEVDVFDTHEWKNYFGLFFSELSKAVDFEAGTLFVYQLGENRLSEVAKTGEGIDFITPIAFPMGNGLSAWVAQKGKDIYLPDIHRGSRHGLNPIRSYLSMPLEINSRIIGVLNLGHIIPNAFDEPKIATIKQRTSDIARKLYNYTYLGMTSSV